MEIVLPLPPKLQGKNKTSKNISHETDISTF